MRLIKRGYEDGYHDALFYHEIENSQRNRLRLQLVLEYCRGGSLLEIGCGTGGFLRVAEAYFAVMGLDISRGAVEQAALHFGDRVQVGDVQTGALAGQRWDVVVAFNILEHLREPSRALGAIAGVLDAGGLLVGSVPYNGALIGRLVTCLGNFVDRTHLSTLSPGHWRDLFARAGFKDIVLFGEIPVGRNHACYLRGSGWRLAAFNLMFVCRR